MIPFSLVAKDARWSYFYRSLTFPITAVLANGTIRNRDNCWAGNDHAERVSLTEHSNYVVVGFFFLFARMKWTSREESIPLTQDGSDGTVPVHFTSKKTAWTHWIGPFRLLHITSEVLTANLERSKNQIGSYMSPALCHSVHDGMMSTFMGCRCFWWAFFAEATHTRTLDFCHFVCCACKPCTFFRKTETLGDKMRSEFIKNELCACVIRC